MINILRALIGKVKDMQKQMGNVSTEMEFLRKDQKEMLEIKNTDTEIKNVFDGLISRLGTTEERISEPEDISIESSKTENLWEKYLKEEQKYPSTVRHMLPVKMEA